MRMHLQITIKCPPDVLWPLIADPKHQRRWVNNLVFQELNCPGTPQPGCCFRLGLQEDDQVVQYQGQLTAFDPPRRLSLTLSGGSFPQGFLLAVDYKLIPTSVAATILEYRAEADTSPLNWLQWLLLPMGRLFAWCQLRSTLQNLKKLAEQPVATGPPDATRPKTLTPQI